MSIKLSWNRKGLFINGGYRSGIFYRINSKEISKKSYRTGSKEDAMERISDRKTCDIKDER